MNHVTQKGRIQVDSDLVGVNRSPILVYSHFNEEPTPQGHDCSRPLVDRAHLVNSVKETLQVRYKADITAGALKLPESRIIADLLLRQIPPEVWKKEIVTDNVLRTKNPATARRLTDLIRGRLELMGPDLWKLIRDGNGTVATHAALAAAIKHSHLLGDFLYSVVGEEYRRFGKSLTYAQWDSFLDECRERDPKMPEWYESTRRRLRSTIFQVLAQAGFIDSTRSLHLQQVHIAQEVIRYLQRHDEDYVLQCIEVSP